MRGFTVMIAFAVVISLVLSIPARAALPSTPSDLWIKTALESIVERDGHFDLDRIGVSVHRGTVKLSGTILTDEEKGLAKLLAMQIPGITAVEDDISVILALNGDLEV